MTYFTFADMKNASFANAINNVGSLLSTCFPSLTEWASIGHWSGTQHCTVSAILLFCILLMLYQNSIIRRQMREIQHLEEHQLEEEEEERRLAREETAKRRGEWV